MFSKNIFSYMPVFSDPILYAGHGLKGISLGPRSEMHMLIEMRQ